MKMELITLTAAQISEKAQLEGIVAAGIKTFREVGGALMVILEKKLYRDEFKTFEKYMDVKWGFTRQRAHQLINAAEVAENVSTVVDIPNERIARELARFPKEVQIKIAEKLFNSAKPITLDRIRQVIEERFALERINSAQINKPFADRVANRFAHFVASFPPDAADQVKEIVRQILADSQAKQKSGDTLPKVNRRSNLINADGKNKAPCPVVKQ